MLYKLTVFPHSLPQYKVHKYLIHAVLSSSRNLIWTTWECEIHNSGWVMPMAGEQAASHPAQSGKDTEKYKTTSKHLRSRMTLPQLNTV